MPTIFSFQVDKASFDSFPNQPQGLYRASTQMRNCWTSARFHWLSAKEASDAGDHKVAVKELALANKDLNNYRQGLRAGGKTTRKKPLGRDWGDGCHICISNTPGGKAAARRKLLDSANYHILATFSSDEYNQYDAYEDDEYEDDEYEDDVQEDDVQEDGEQEDAVVV